jgi:predicted helicase
METADDKLAWLGEVKLAEAGLTEIEPDAKHSWIDLGNPDFDALVPLIDRTVKDSSSRQEKAIFRLYSAGLKSQRDEWVYDYSRDALESRMRVFVDGYEAARLDPSLRASSDIKWDRELDRYLSNGVPKKFSAKQIVMALYRPFVRQYLYFDRHFNAMQYKMAAMFGDGDQENLVIAFSDRGSRAPFSVLASATIPELHLCASTDAFQVVPLNAYRDGASTKSDNITDWGADRFKKHYQPGRDKKDRPITKDAIFRYVYAVLHDPVYREKYAPNLRREFPRIPFYPDFWQWADWGKALMDLHIGYESVAPFALKRADTPDEKASKAGLSPKAMLKAIKETGRIQLDSETTLSGVPADAWNYKLGNRSALEWVLDQYKETKPKDPTIREKFDTYRFADYKDKVIDLLTRVTTVSVETVKIIKQMSAAPH